MTNFRDIVRQTKVQYCLDCGKCTSVCPVSRFDTNFSPRLIVQKALRHPRKIYSDPSIWSCLGCNMCSIRCNYHVDYVDFIRYLRMHARDNGTELIYSHNEVPESLMHLMGKKNTAQQRRQWIPRDIVTDESSDTAFFVGCAPYFDIIFNNIGVKSTDGPIGAMRMLNAATISYKILGNERCCGHDLLLSGDLRGFLDLGQANIREFENSGIQKLVVACPECYYTLKVDYPRHFENWKMEIQHITELPGILNLGRKNGETPLARKATYHDSCRLGRYFKMFCGPRNLLLSSANVELVEMESNRESALCCGASPWMFCGSVNKQIQDERLRQASNTGADLLITSCPKCQIHLKCAQASVSAAGNKIEIADIYHVVSQNLAIKENI
jgi:heterodisulfide reductase subunit D